MKMDLDYITLIVNKKDESNEKLGGTYLGNIFILNLSQELNFFFEKNQWAPAYSKANGIIIKETKNNHQINMSGEFFLRPDYIELLKKVLNFLITKNYDWHATRVDVAITTTTSLDELLMLMKNTQTFNEMTFASKGIITYKSYYNSRFALIFYNKKLQLEKAKKSNSKYVQMFQDKYYKVSEKIITRIETRTKGKDTLFLLRLSKNPEDFFKKLEKIYEENIRKRLKKEKKLIALLLSNSIKN